jgi:hypothetical protein
MTVSTSSEVVELFVGSIDSESVLKDLILQKLLENSLATIAPKAFKPLAFQNLATFCTLFP